MSSIFVSVHDLEDPFVDLPCPANPATGRAHHQQAPSGSSIQSSRPTSKTDFSAEDVERIVATRRRRRKQLVAFLKNRTHLRKLDKVLYDNMINTLDADDRDFLIQQGPWEIVELPNGDQALESRREEFQGAMAELDDDTVAVGLKCRETLSAHTSLKAIYDRLRGKDEALKQGRNALQTCKFDLNSYVEVMRDMFASFRRVPDGAGNSGNSSGQLDADTRSVHVSDAQVPYNHNSSATTASTTSLLTGQSDGIARTSTTSLNSEWQEIEVPHPHETLSAVQTL